MNREPTSTPPLLPPSRHRGPVREMLQLLSRPLPLTILLALVGLGVWRVMPSVANGTEEVDPAPGVRFLAEELRVRQQQPNHQNGAAADEDANTPQIQFKQNASVPRPAQAKTNTQRSGPSTTAADSRQSAGVVSDETKKQLLEELSWQQATARWTEGDSWNQAKKPPFQVRKDRPLLAATSAPWADLVDAEADALILDTNAEMSIAVIDINRGHQYGYKELVPRYLASGIKLFYMFELFRQRDAGLLHFDEQILYTNSDVRDGAPTMNRSRRNIHYRVHNLLAYMIRDSDNAAADMIAERVGLDNVSLTMDQLKLTRYGPVANILDLRKEVHRTLDPRSDRLNSIQIRDVRWRNGFKPRLDILKKHIGPPHGTYGQTELESAYIEYYKKQRNHLNMKDVAFTLARLTKEELFTQDTTFEILYLMENTWNSNTRIVGAVPQGTRVAHKTGTQHKRICDLAVLGMPNGDPLVVAIAVEGIDRVPAENILFQITQTIYDVVKEFSMDGVEEEYNMFSSENPGTEPAIAPITSPG
jgi:beta-lactamase class A